MQIRMMRDWIPSEPYDCEPIRDGDILDVWGPQNGSWFLVQVPWVDRENRHDNPLLALIPTFAAEVRDPRTYFVWDKDWHRDPDKGKLIAMTAGIDEARSIRKSVENFATVTSVLGATAFDIYTEVLEINAEGIDMHSEAVRNKKPPRPKPFLDGSDHIHALIRLDRERVERSEILQQRFDLPGKHGLFVKGCSSYITVDGEAIQIETVDEEAIQIPEV